MPRKARLASIGYEFADSRVACFPFLSPRSLLDYDIVLWKPEPLTDVYSREYESPSCPSYWRPCITTAQSAQSLRDADRRRSEMLTLLESGRTLIVFMPAPATWYYHTGHREFSGTGKNRQTTNIVDGMDVFSLFPFAYSAKAGQGEEIDLKAGEPFSTFWREYREWFRYEAYLEKPIGTPLLAIADTGLCVGCVAGMGKGLMLLLPQLVFADDWDEEESATDEVRQGDPFFDALIQLVGSLKGDLGEFSLPDWASNYLLPSEGESLDRVDELEAEASKLLTRADEQKKRLLLLQQGKILFTGTGEALRLVAQQAFQALGFEVSEGAPGRTDLVLSSKEGVAVAEVKGLGKSAREKDAAQLEKWVSEYQIANEAVPKGVLLVNAYSSKPLSERPDVSFPDQMLPYSTARGHCLMTGWQLLCAWLEAGVDGRRKAGIRKSILNCVGRYDRYEDWDKYVSAKAKSAPADTPEE
jgi:hypothetical protein